MSVLTSGDKKNPIILECQHIQVSLLQSPGALPTAGSHLSCVSLVNARGCVVLQSGILLRKAGIAGAPPPPGRALAHGSIPGALPAFPLTTNPSPAFPGERLRSLRGFIRAH